MITGLLDCSPFVLFGFVFLRRLGRTALLRFSSVFRLVLLLLFLLLWLLLVFVLLLRVVVLLLLILLRFLRLLVLRLGLLDVFENLTRLFRRRVGGRSILLPERLSRLLHPLHGPRRQLDRLLVAGLELLGID